MTALVEYVLRIRVEERASAPTNGESGEAMALLLGEIEFDPAVMGMEVISRTILAGPDTPSRVRCAARSLDPSRHYATSTRYTLTTPSGDTVTLCRAACAVSWLCREGLPADTQKQCQNSADGTPACEAAA